jgi:hypothetical protein
MEDYAMGHVVLLGDSIFDNAAYVAGGPDVRTQLEETLPLGWEATLLAVDGNTVIDVHDQLVHIPDDATHLILSVGGNDALGYMDLLTQRVNSIADAILFLSTRFADFQRKYQELLKDILSHNLPAGVCTVYYPRFDEPELQSVACTALSLFNDCIIREAIVRRVPLLYLRIICNEDRDYANPIEPSSHGGAKIAKAIADLVAEHDFQRRRTQVFV